MPRTDAEWIALGRRAILELLAQERAMVWPEAEARISNQKWHGLFRVDPNHLLTARTQLLASGQIAMTAATPTRGGRAVTVFHEPVVNGNRRAVLDASMRKRLLYARVVGWATGSVRTGSGLMGRAGENVARATLNSDDLRHLYAPVYPSFAEAAYLLGEPVPGGPLDSAAYQLSAPGGIPLRPVILPIEVKNLREWIFPRTPELYQLLHKAAIIQQRHATDSVAPLIICHRRHIMTFYMAQDLGFFVVETHRQYMSISAEAPMDRVEEVRVELGYSFLTTDSGPDPILLKVLRDTIPPRSAATAERWATHGANLAPYYDELRHDSLRGQDRESVMDSLFEAAMHLPNVRGGWRTPLDRGTIDDYPF